MRIRVGAYGLIRDADGRVLLCRVSEPGTRDHGKWTLPGGGLDPGEEPFNAAIREVREETGLEVALHEVVGVDSIVANHEGAPLHCVRIVFRASVTGGELRAEPDGTTDACDWFSAEDLEGLDCVSLAMRYTRLAGT